jgi:hypothetical protein
MAVSFRISIEKISKASAILSAIGRNLGLTRNVSVAQALVKMGPKKALKTFRDATQPTQVRFYNPDPVTDICQSLNGKVWKIGDQDIQQPPLHWNCKSVLIYER